MTKRKGFLMILAMALILPFAFMLSGCFGNNNNDNNNPDTPLPEGYYRITAQQTTGGSVNASKSSAQEGEEITLSYRANSGYLFVKLTVKDGNNQDVELNDNKFTMPASDVTILATFERISNQKYFLDLQHGDNCVIELISPDERQWAEDRGLIQAGTRVVLGCDIWNEGYELKSWNVVDANGNSIAVDSNNSFIMPNSMVTVSVVVGEITYTVSVDEETARMVNVTIRNEDNGNSIVENGGTVKYNDRIALSYEFKVQGYTLNGWKNQNGERLSATSILVQSNLVISATFSPNQYSLKIDDIWREDGDYNSAGTTSFYLLNKDGQRIDLLSNSTERNKARTDEEITIHCDPKNQNFAVEYFILRSYEYGLNEEHITTNTFNMLPHNVEVSVKMKLVENTYNVNYVLDGGTMPNDAPTTFKSTDKSLVIANPTRDRYRFEGWEEDIINVSDLDVAISLTPFELTEDLTLTANWVRVAYITYDYSHYCQYDLDGFKGKYVDDNNPSNYASTEVITFKDPIYAYGDFRGWYTSPTFEEESKITVWVGDENDLVDITLYAKMDLKSFHINFVKVRVAPDGTRRTLASSDYLDWFDLAEDPRDLTRDIYNGQTYTLGYTFGGFYKDFDLTEPITSVSNEETQNIIVYAKESVEVYQIEYYEYHNGQYEKVIIPNAATAYFIDTPAFQLPNSYYQNGYFRGWRLNNEGDVFEPYTQITPSQDPDKYHGTLKFYAYYY